MSGQRIPKLRQLVWNWIGHVPLRTKIIGIVIAATCLTGFGIILWTNSRLGHANSLAVSSINPFELGELWIAMGIAMTIGLIVAWILTGILTQQVQEVTRVAQQVQHGNLSKRAPVWANDEIGDLGEAFNAMINSVALSKESLEITNAQLAARNEELTALYELAMLATRALNADSILPNALSKILEISNSEAGMVLLSSGEGALTLRAAQQLPPGMRDKPALFTGGDPLLQKVVQTAQPVLMWSPDHLCDGEYSSLCAAASACGFEFVYAAPLQSHSAVNGVIVLLQHNDKTKLPDDKHISFLAAVCNQLSVVVENATLWEELIHKEAIRARLLAKAVTAQEQERERISRELHDETGQALTALLVQLKVFEHLHDPQAVAAQVAELRKLVLGTLEEVRRLARDLRPATLDELGLVPTIEWYVKTFTRNTELRVEFDALISEDLRLPVHTELALYRVVQEALTNVARHSQATQTLIRLEEQRGTLGLTIRDNGRGFDVNTVMNAEERSLGLHGIQERVELIDGVLTLESTVGQGTSLRVEVPVLERVAAG
ncbi:MAG: HAMP domain-containing protein [Anaerolineae bacterium]|nr:HAMP domain-containing protein [Anaerolineae bacterium]